MKLSEQVQEKSFQVTRQVPPLKQGLGCGRVRVPMSKQESSTLPHDHLTTS